VDQLGWGGTRKIHVSELSTYFHSFFIPAGYCHAVENFDCMNLIL